MVEILALLGGGGDGEGGDSDDGGGDGGDGDDGDGDDGDGGGDDAAACDNVTARRGIAAMKFKLTLQSIAASVFLCVAGGVDARMYQVEVIVVAAAGARADSGEVLNDGRWAEVVWEVPAGMRDADGESLADEDAIQMYPGSLLTPYLNELAEKNSYRVLRYMSWVQPVAEKEKVSAVDLSTPGLADVDREPELSGVAHVYVIQPYLQVELDLRYRADEDEGAVGGVGANQVRSVHSAYGLSLQKQRAYRLRQKRRVRLNEINYYDHPRFGVLMVVSRFAGPAPATAPATAPESTTPATRRPAGG